jgi:hypothetical protein
MTTNHAIYIPLVVIVGIFLGFILGARAARNAYDLERRRDEERAIAKAAREERKARKAADPQPPV